MPKHSNAYVSSIDRGAVARELYLKRGASEASARCEWNTRLGRRDLGAEIVRRLLPAAGEVIVDVGCGTGQHLREIAAVLGNAHSLIGIDFSADAIRAVRRSGLPGILASGDRLPLRSASVDALICNYAIYYLSDLGSALSEWARVLRTNGRLLITGPAGDTNAELYAFHERATRQRPSDADRMALGFVEGPVAASLARFGFRKTALIPFENQIVFTTEESFLDYWTATSLYVRTPGATRQQGRKVFERDEAQVPTVITKRTTILEARRQAA